MGENLIAVVTPFTHNANYSINFPYLMEDYIMSVDGNDVELWWKKADVKEFGIIYKDEAGRKFKVQEGIKVDIPAVTQCVSLGCHIMPRWG